MCPVNARQSIVAKLRTNTAFKNPEIMGQLVKLVELEERGSNYPAHVYDYRAPLPDHTRLAEEQQAFLAALVKKQEDEQAKRPK